MRLVTHSDARLRLAVVALLILHPEWAPQVHSLVKQSAEPVRTDLQALYTAAVYLQRFWHTRLGFYLGRFEALPDLYSAELGLPPAGERHGKTGLHELSAWQARRSPIPMDWLESYRKLINHLFEQLKIDSRIHESTSTR